MKAPAPKKELIPEGNYTATLYRIIYLGVEEGEYMGQPTSAYKVDLTWELNDELKTFKEGDEPKPIVVSKKYTLSMGDKSNLLPIVKGMVGGLTPAQAADFDVNDILGKSCLLNITHKTSPTTGNVYLEVSTSLLPKSMPTPKPFNKQVILEYGDNWNQELFDSLPDWMKDNMKKTIQYQIQMGTVSDKLTGFDAERVKSQIDQMNADYQKSLESGEVNPADIPF